MQGAGVIPRTMREVTVLEPLVRAAERLGVDLILFGSAASRVALLHAAEDPPRSLFEIAEHASDIDLAHTGPPALTERLRIEIEREVPLAPWLRWSLIDWSGWANFQIQQEMNFGIPLRRVQLATHSMLNAPQEEAIAQALDGTVAFQWNEAFKYSPRAARDTEVSAALVHFDAVVDVAGLGRLREPGMPLRWDPELTVRAIETGLGRLREMDRANGILAARRMWYRFAALAMRVPMEFIVPRRAFFPDFDPVANALAEWGYGGSIEALRQDVTRPFVLSATDRDGSFRFDPVADRTTTSDPDPYAAFRKSADRLGDGREGFDLASGDRVLSAITDLNVRRGETPSERGWGALAQEFVHVSVVAGEVAARRAVENLSAIAIGHGKRGSILLPAYAIVSRGASFGRQAAASIPERFPFNGRTTIRLNFAGMLDDVDRVDVFLVGGDEPRGE